MIRLATLLLMFVLAACGPGVAATVCVSSHPDSLTVCLDLPDGQMFDAVEGVKAWDAALGKWHHVVPVRHGHGCTIVVRETKRPLAAAPTALAWCACIGCKNITMLAGSYEQDVSGILQHEIGHALGAQHAEGTLMDPIWTEEGYKCPDRTTVLQVAGWNHIDESLVTWCNPEAKER